MATAAAASPSAQERGEPPQEMFYSTAGLQRAAERRSQREWLAEAIASSETKIVPVWQCKVMTSGDRGVTLTSADLAEDLAAENRIGPIFLGLSASQGLPVFALGVTGDSAGDEEGPRYAAAPAAARWVDLRRDGPNLRPEDAALFAFARGLVDWHTKNAFCGRCGAEQAVVEAGHALKCTSASCGASGYPRLDPAVIMLVTCGDYVLLGRQARWDKGRYSLLAGFVELGETFEMAVAREVLEEAGVEVDISSVRYAASQPWPFPSSLMIGFTAAAAAQPPALATSGGDGGAGGAKGASLREDERAAILGAQRALPAPQVDTLELEEARWIHRDFVRAAVSEGGAAAAAALPGGTLFGVPGRYAIARVLLERWAAEGSTAALDDVLPSVRIDTGDGLSVLSLSGAGVLKYVLMRVSSRRGGGGSKLIVRGDKLMPFHRDILEAARAEASPHGLKVEPLGGGRMEHRPELNVVRVYGFSQAFGQADHEVTAALVRRWYPFYEVTTSNDGY